jgi:hypothetical protein
MSDIELPETLGGEPLHELTTYAYGLLGPAMTAGDREGDWLLLKFMDACVHELKPVWDMVVSNSSRPGWWDAFDPQARPGAVLPWLPWLMQFTGDLYDTSLIGYNPNGASPDQPLRDQVSRLRNWRRGTLNAIEDVILERLPSGALVSFTERVLGDVTHLTIAILASDQLSNAQVGMLYQAVSASLPAGDTFNLDITTGYSFDEVAALLGGGSYDDRRARWPKFDSLPKVVQPDYQGELPTNVVFPATVPWSVWNTRTWGYIGSKTWDELERRTP